MARRSWTDAQLAGAVAESETIRQVIFKLGLVPAGGNYQQVTEAISKQKLSIAHFLGRKFRLGKKIRRTPIFSLEDILVRDSKYKNLHKLKLRLIHSGIKNRECEECGWARRSVSMIFGLMSTPCTA
jgi:hypothetical protein